MTTDPSCIFCRIAANEIPSTHVYEDEMALVFMDINPLTKGHTLVIPKEHFNPITKTPDEVLQHLIVVARKVAQAQFAALKANGVNIHQANGAAAGQVVPHLHFHVIPRYSDDPHYWNWNPISYADPTEPTLLANRMKAAIAEGT